MTTAERIRKKRLEKGLTQKQLADKLKCATGTIQQYELGKRQPRIEQLKRMAKALECPVIELLDLEDQKGSENMETYLATAKEVAAMLGVSESMSYKIIKECNQELRKKGYITVRGKVPREYLKERVGIKTM